MKHDNLNDLKAGDKVAIMVSGYADDKGVNLGKVIRVTKTQIVATYTSQDFEMKFRKADGRQVGSDYGGFHNTAIELFTADHAETIRSRNLEFKVTQIAGLIGRHAHLVTTEEAHELDKIRLNLKARAAEIKEKEV